MHKRIRKQAGRWLFALFRAAFLLGVSYIILFPLLYALSTAFKTTPQLTDPTVTWLPKELTLENFSVAMQVLDYGRAMLTTVLVCIGSALLQVASCALAGYGFARLPFRGRSLLFGLVVLTMIVPPQAILVPLYANYANVDFLGILSLLRAVFPGIGKINLLNSPLTFYLPSLLGVGLRSGFMIFIYRQFFKGLPRELEEAAWIDGAGPVKTFLRIIIPSVGVAVLVVFIFSLIWYWNDYQQASLFFESNQPLAVKLSQIQSNLTMLPGYSTSTDTSNVLMAGVLLFVTPVLAVYLVVQRYFIQGIENTGLVG